MRYNCNSLAVPKTMLNMRSNTDTSVSSQVLSANRYCTNCTMKTLLFKGRNAKMINVSPCSTHGLWRARPEDISLRCCWLTSLQIPTSKELHKHTGNNTCRPQAGRIRTPPYSETTTLPTTTCQWPTWRIYCGCGMSQLLLRLQHTVYNTLYRSIWILTHSDWCSP